MRKKIDTTAIAAVQEKIGREEIQKLLDENYMRYTFYVMEDRALPDARDGLKPSQRRILYAMHTLGLASNKSRVKSALICGETSGRYHPHGEGVVYPTMVRMAQDFSMRYPLIAKQGNFGNLDGDPPAAMRYCLVGDSLLNTENGFVKIKDISTSEDIDIWVSSVGNKINSASKFFSCGKHPIKRITTRHGYTEAGSHNHPLLVLAKDINGKPVFGWKTLDTISLGDFVVLSRGAMFPEEELNLTKFHPKATLKEKGIALPETLNSNLSLLMGALIAEGWIDPKRFGYVNNEGDYLNAFINALDECFDADNTYIAERQPSGISVQPYYNVELHRTQVVRFLRNIGMELSVKAQDKSIPWSILQSPKHIQSVFLASLFEGDGGVEKDCQRITLTTKSKSVAEQCQVMLLGFGIISNNFYDNKRNIYRVCITGKNNISCFIHDIGFLSIEKDSASTRLLDSMSNCKTSAQENDYIPYLSEYVRAKGSGDWIIKNNFDRVSRLKDAMPQVCRSLKSNQEAIDWVQHLCDLNYVYSEVTSIVDEEDQDVYSIKVDSDCHSFVANGFFNHNTEAKLSKYGDLMLQDINEDIVAHTPTYDESRKEPTVLPSYIPNLLINGAEGIAVGVATKIPSHNLCEVTEVIKAYIANKGHLSTDEIIDLMPGPDFPIACELRGQSGVRSYYETGRGTLQLDGVYEIKTNAKGQEVIRITGFPPSGSPEAFCLQLKDLTEDKKIDGIATFDDLSTRHKQTREIDICVEIEVSKSSSADLVLNQLLKSTCLRENYSVNNTVLVNGRVMENAGMLTLIESFVEHRKLVLTNKFTAEKKSAERRVHILDGLLNVTKHIDEVIKLIRAADSGEDAIAQLIEKGYVWTEVQAKAVLAITLRQLTKLESKLLQDEHDGLVKRIEWLTDILANVGKLMKYISNEQEEIAKKYGDDRRTIVGDSADDIELEDLIKEEKVVITLTKDGYIRRIPVASYNVQHRGGKGVIGVGKRDTDESGDIFVASTHDVILFFTNKGLMYRKKGYQIPEGSRTGKGVHLANLLQLGANETVTSTIPLDSFNKDGHYIMMVTKGGLIKRTLLIDYASNRKNKGFQAIKLREDDEVAFVEITDNKKDVFIATANGKAIRYNESLVRPTGRVTAGVQALKLNAGDSIAQAFTIIPAENPDILVMTSMGFGKRTNAKDYRILHGRTAKGVNTIDKLKLDRNGAIIGAAAVNDDKELLILTTKGKMIRIPAGQIRSTGRVTMGVRLVNLDLGDTVHSFGVVDNK